MKELQGKGVRSRPLQDRCPDSKFVGKYFEVIFTFLSTNQQVNQPSQQSTNQQVNQQINQPIHVNYSSNF